MKMSRDELEFAISQYHDGGMPPLERAVVEEQLATNAEAREILAEYQRLDGMMRSEPALALPAMDWDEVHARLSGAVANEAMPIKRLRIVEWQRWVGSAAAVAAAVAIVLFVSIKRDHTSRVADTGKPKIEGTAIVQVTISPPDSQMHVARSITDVNIGPSPAVANAGWQYLDDSILNRPARVVIAGGGEPAQDGGSSPYQ